MTVRKRSRGAIIACMFLGASVLAHGVAAQNMNRIDMLADISAVSRFVGFRAHSDVPSVLQAFGPFTTRVPTNHAVSTAARHLLNFVFQTSDGNRADIAVVRTPSHAHVLEGQYPSADISPGRTVKSQKLASASPEFTTAHRVITIMEADSQPASRVRSKALCSNGIIRFIDRVLVC